MPPEAYESLKTNSLIANRQQLYEAHGCWMVGFFLSSTLGRSTGLGAGRLRNDELYAAWGGCALGNGLSSWDAFSTINLQMGLNPSLT